MKRGLQKEISKKTGITEASVSMILNGHRRPSWRIAKKLAAATNTKPELWLEGELETIRQKIEDISF